MIRWMCWVRDFWCPETEQWYVEYYCKRADYRVTKLKSHTAPRCFYMCDGTIAPLEDTDG